MADFFDDFARADGPLTAPWQDLGLGMVIESQIARAHSSGVSGPWHFGAVVDTGESDGIIVDDSQVVVPSSSSNPNGVAFRCDSTGLARDGHVFGYVGGDDTLMTRTYTGGVGGVALIDPNGGRFDPTIGASNILRVEMVGDNIRCFCNGILIFDFTESLYQTYTNHGITTRNNVADVGSNSFSFQGPVVSGGFFTLNGIDQWISTPYTGDLDIISDVEMVAKAAIVAGGNKTIMSGWSGNSGYMMGVNTLGNIVARHGNGSIDRFGTSSPLVLAPDITQNYGAQFDVSAGDWLFYVGGETQIDALGLPGAGLASGIEFTIGATTAGTSGFIEGDIYYVEVRSGVGGPLAIDMHAAASGLTPGVVPDGTTWVGNDGRTYTAHGNLTYTAPLPANSPDMFFLRFSDKIKDFNRQTLSVIRKGKGKG